MSLVFPETPNMMFCFVHAPKRSFVHCHGGAKKPGNTHIEEAEIGENFDFLLHENCSINLLTDQLLQLDCTRRSHVPYMNPTRWHLHPNTSEVRSRLTDSYWITFFVFVFSPLSLPERCMCPPTLKRTQMLTRCKKKM